MVATVTADGGSAVRSSVHRAGRRVVESSPVPSSIVDCASHNTQVDRGGP